MKIRDNKPKPCGCEPKGLTRAFALWMCAGCGHVQRAPRRAGARCLGSFPDGTRCDRVKGANPVGFPCCGQDVRKGQACPDCGNEGDGLDMGRLPHPEVEYLTESCERGYFRARDSFLRCVGCLELAPNGMD